MTMPSRNVYGRRRCRGLLRCQRLCGNVPKRARRKWCVFLASNLLWVSLMRLTTPYHHTRYEEHGSEDKFSLRMPRRKSSLFKSPVLIQFQVIADTMRAITCQAVCSRLLRGVDQQYPPVFYTRVAGPRQAPSRAQKPVPAISIVLVGASGSFWTASCTAPAPRSGAQCQAGCWDFRLPGRILGHSEGFEREAWRTSRQLRCGEVILVFVPYGPPGATEL